MVQSGKKKTPWNLAFRRLPDRGREGVTFFVKGTRTHLYSFDGYQGGHEVLNRIIGLCHEHGFHPESQGGSAPGYSTASYQDFYEFFDGGLTVSGGNHLVGEFPHGAYIRGFKAFRWVLENLGYAPPGRLKGER